MRRSTILVGLVAGAYFLIFSVFTALRQYHFQTQAWDMGIFDQLFWNTIHGSVIRGSIEEIPRHFGIHFSPFLLVLVPFYAIIPSPYTLLVLQTIALAVGVFPLYGIARKKLPQSFPAIVAAAYLLSPALHWITTFDFHEIAFFIPLFLAGFYYTEKEKYLPAAAFFLAAASTKEDAALAILAAGLVFAIQGYRSGDPIKKKFGIAAAILSFMFFAAVSYWIMPAFGGGLLRLDRYATLGGTLPSIFSAPVMHPILFISTIFQAQKLAYLFWLFFPLLFIPLIAGAPLLIVLPGIAENILTTYRPQFSELYQYDAILLPGFLVAFIYGLAALVTRFPRHIPKIKVLLYGTIAVGFLFRSPLSPITFPVALFSSNPAWDTYQTLISTIPPDASVAAPTELIPHLSERKYAYVLGTEPAPTDAVIIDAGDLTGFANTDAFQAYADSYINSGNYAMQTWESRYIVLLRKHP